MSETFIRLTASDADLVRGETSPGAWLVPVPLADGTTHILPERVLWDPAHAAAVPRLSGLPRQAFLPHEVLALEAPAVPD